MCSNKRNSILAIAISYRLDFDFFTVQRHFLQRCAFCQLQQLQYLHNVSTKALLCTSFLSPLPQGDDLRYIHYGFNESAVLFFLAWSFTPNIQSTVAANKARWYTMIEWHTPSFWLITGAHFSDQTFHIFCNGLIDYRDSFHAVLHL